MIKIPNYKHKPFHIQLLKFPGTITATLVSLLMENGHYGMDFSTGDGGAGEGIGLEN